MVTVGMRRESAKSGSSDDDETVVAELVGWLNSGAGAAEARVFSLYGQADTDFQSKLLDGVAQAAAQDCPYALSTLLGIVDEYHLARGALANTATSQAEWQDVEQSVLIAVARSIHQFRSDSRFTTWLYAVARNVAISEGRKLKPTVGLDQAGASVHGLRTPLRRLSSLVAEERLIESVIEQLPDPYRETVYLRDVLRLRYSDIAERQGIAVNTVKSRLSRGRQLLADAWDQHHQPPARTAAPT